MCCKRWQTATPNPSVEARLNGLAPRSSERHALEVALQGDSNRRLSAYQRISWALPNKHMQPTHRPVIKFAWANLSPVWRADDAWPYPR